MEIRKAYTETLKELMRQNDKIVVLDADLASAGGTKSLTAEFPDRVINVGIAEANMTNIAVGLAAYGFVPFIHSFSPFVSRRNFDQIAIGVSYSSQNVKIASLDPGVTATYNGGTHMTFEDIALMRSLPNIVVCDIADSIEMSRLLPQIASIDSPVYFRFGRKLDDTLFDQSYNPQLGKIEKLANGSDITIVSSGILTFEAAKAVEILKSQHNVSAELLHCHTIKPLDCEMLLDSVKKTNCVLTAENHSVHGGLHNAVSAFLSSQYPVFCDAIAVHDKSSQVGNLPDLLRDYQLTAKDIVSKSLVLIGKKSKK